MRSHLQDMVRRLPSEQHTPVGCNWAGIPAADGCLWMRALTSDGATAFTNAQKATIFNDHFSSVFTRENNANIPELEEEMSTNSNPDTIEDLVFDSAEVLEELSNINANKCGGPDGIPAILLKEVAQSIDPIY